MKNQQDDRMSRQEDRKYKRRSQDIFYPDTTAWDPS